MTERWNRLLPPVSAPTAHLYDAEIAATHLDVNAEKHLANCGWCHTRYEQVSADDRSALDALLGELATAPIRETTLEAAAALTVPTNLLHYLDANPVDIPDVAPAQLWRMAWHGRTQLAVTVDRDSWWVTVAPVSSDVALADEYTAICDASATSLNTEAAVFMRAATTVPLYALAGFLGDVHPSTTDDPSAWLHQLHHSAVQQTPPPTDVPTGPVLAIDDWDRQGALDTLLEDMRWFAAAAVEFADGDEAEEANEVSHEVPAGKAGSATELLRAPGVDVLKLANSTGIELGRLVDLAQGGGQPTPDEQRALSDHFGVAVSQSEQEVLRRRALLQVVPEPRYRALWEASTSAGSPAVLEPGTLRLLVARLLNDKIAARTVAGTGRSPDADLEAWRVYWRDLLAMMLP